MSKYSEKKRRQAEMQPKIDAFVEKAVAKFKARQRATEAAERAEMKARKIVNEKRDDDEKKRIEKYNNRRANERMARREAIRELSNPELVVMAKQLEKEVSKQLWKVSEIMGELRRRFVLSLGLSNELTKILTSE